MTDNRQTAPVLTRILALRRADAFRSMIRAVIDLAALTFALLLAFELRFEFATPAVYRQAAINGLPFVLGLKFAALYLFGIHRRSWRFVSLTDATSLSASMLVPIAILAVTRPWIPTWLTNAALPPIPIGVLGADAVLSVFALLGVRAMRRLQIERHQVRTLEASADQGVTPKRVIVVGAGQSGNAVVRQIQARPDLKMTPVGYLEHGRTGRGNLINGVPVLGGIDDLATTVVDHAIDQVVIAMAHADGATIRSVDRHCRELGVEVRIVPAVHDILHGRVELSRMRPVSIEDLLRREPVALDTAAISTMVEGATVLVTGAGGSIGTELSRQIARYRPERLILLDQSEGALWAIHRELESGTCPVVPIVADVTYRDRLDRILLASRPTVVFHAAAHKHVPIMEANPDEAIRNNVIGTRIVADAAVAAGVARFVLISTDKAVSPTSVMGVTKRIAERYVQWIAETTGQPFVSVRFGNVLGSTGSVVPIFEDQIAKGGPVTVTHPDMTRFLMTIPEAVALVIQASAIGRPGDTLVLDMGEPVRILDLAHDLIRLSGHEPDVEIPIAFTGIRPGEKLHESLLSDHEAFATTAHPSLRVVTANTQVPWRDPQADLDRLALACDEGDLSTAFTMIRSIVPEFTHPSFVGDDVPS